MSLPGAISDFVAQALKPAAPDAAPKQPSPEDDPSKNGRILKSWTGVAIVFVVIAVFILTATFLKSVLFGLILAYFFLPMEKFFEARLKRLFKSSPKDALALKASLLTFASLGLGIALALAIALAVALPAISRTGDRIKSWAASSETFKKVETQVKSSLGKAPRPPSQEEAATEQAASRGNVEAFAFWTASQFEGLLKGKDAKQEIASIAIDNGQDIVLGAASITKMLSALLFDALLALFFFFYFLQKMAVFETREAEGGASSTGAWLVKGIFESPWMPKTAADAQREAAEVIDKICGMLKTWVRGYLSIILIESCLYVTAFLLFGVPYAVPLGLLAGSTILLPFIGPVASVALTLCVCIVGGPQASLFTIVGVLASYLLVNVAIEQIFLYPRLVGEALGLTTLETVIVVLLGGLFAGIPGMIFAVPAAAVLKYMIPTIYHCWSPGQPKAAKASGPGL